MLRDRVDRYDVLDHVDHQSRVHVRVEEQHVADAAVGDRRTEHRNIVLRAPVVHRLFVLDTLAEQLDHLRRRPDLALE